jgi:hypothetical protein
MRAYSLDLRQKIVEAVWQEMSKTEAASASGLGITSVKRYLNVAQEGESLVRKRFLARNANSIRGNEATGGPPPSPRGVYPQRAKLSFELFGVRVREAPVCRGSIAPATLSPSRPIAPIRLFLLYPPVFFGVQKVPDIR